MRRRNRYRDARDARQYGAKPEHCRYEHGEPARQRHARRLDTAVSLLPEIAEWCNANGWSLALRNHSHHWTFTGHGTTVEWWPSSAKFVRDKKWNQGIHTHDWAQVQSLLQRIDKI